MKRQHTTKTHATKQSRLWKRCASLAAIGAVAGLAIGCGVPHHDPSGALGATLTVPKGTEKQAERISATTPKRDEPAKPIATVKARWSGLDLGGDVSLLVEWQGSAILKAEKDGTTTLYTLGNDLRQGSYARPSSLLSFRGKLHGLLAHSDQLLMLREMDGTTELCVGTLQEGRLQWRTLRTYKADEAPRFLRQFRDEVLVMGQGRMARFNWHQGELIEIKQKAPKDLEQLACDRDICVALIAKQAAPVQLNADWRWSDVELELEQETTDASAGKPQHTTPTFRHRSLSLRDGKLLYTVNGMLFLSCDLAAEPLRRIASDADLLAAQWAGVSLARVYKQYVLLHRGEQRARLTLPGILQRASDSEFTLTTLKSTAHFMLLKNSEGVKDYHRYHIAYHSSPLAANPACR